MDIGVGRCLYCTRPLSIKQGKTTAGFICCHVDDMMVIGEQHIVEVMAGHIKKEWDATDLEWANTEKPLKFCGVEVIVKPGGGGELLVGQEDCTKDVINRYGSEVKEKLICAEGDREGRGGRGAGHGDDSARAVAVGDWRPAGHQLWREPHSPADCAASGPEIRERLLGAAATAGRDDGGRHRH